MQIVNQWNAAPLIGERLYERILREPGELASICPPSLNRMDETLSARRTFVDRHIDRPGMVASLRESHRRRGAPPSSFHSIEQLQEKNCFLIIAGQQPGLLGGPLFTYYKALHAIALAKRLTRERQEIFVPALWDASEDHDFPEIAAIHWLSKDRKAISYTWPGREESRRPYFHIPISECPVDELLKQIRETTHPTEFQEPLFEQIRDCAQGVQSYPDFFDRLLWLLFPDDGLIVIRPDDIWMRRQAKPLIEREIRDPQRSAAGVERIGARLLESGLPPQIHKRADRTSFFLIEGNERIPVYVAPGGFVTDTGRVWTRDDLLKRLETQPECFSPSAVLRPVIQDALLPAAAAVLGPSEIAYHFLLDDIYQAQSVPRPVLVPRFGLTLLDDREMNWMGRYGLQPADWLENPTALAKRIARTDSAVAWEPERQAAENALSKLFDLWKHRAQQNDSSLPDILGRNLFRIQKEIEQSETLLTRKIGEKNDQTQKHIESLQNSLYPNGTLQERRYTIFSYLLKYGTEMLNGFADVSLAVEDGEHCLVQIP